MLGAGCGAALGVGFVLLMFELSVVRGTMQIYTNHFEWRRSLSGSIADLKDRYISLLQRSLTGEIYEDNPFGCFSEGRYDQEKRAFGMDWPSKAQTMIGGERMKNLRFVCETVLKEQIPGDLIETGVWRGGACIFMRGILAAYGDTTRRVFVADSFQGLPKPNADKFSADQGDKHHTFTELMVPRSEVENNFKKYDLIDDNVLFLEGWFKDTLPRAPIDKLAVLRLDGDMYESTIQALDALYHKVSVGGFIIIDDYGLSPCAKAVTDFRDKHGIRTTINRIDHYGVWWRVEKKIS